MKLKWLLLYLIIFCTITGGCAPGTLPGKHNEEIKPTFTSNTTIDTEEEQVSPYLSITTTNKSFENVYHEIGMWITEICGYLENLGT